MTFLRETDFIVKRNSSSQTCYSSSISVLNCEIQMYPQTLEVNSGSCVDSQYCSNPIFWTHRLWCNQFPQSVRFEAHVPMIWLDTLRGSGVIWRYAFYRAAEKTNIGEWIKMQFGMTQNALRKVKRVNIFLNDDQKISLRHSWFAYCLFLSHAIGWGAGKGRKETMHTQLNWNMSWKSSGLIYRRKYLRKTKRTYMNMSSLH